MWRRRAARRRPAKHADHRKGEHGAIRGRLVFGNTAQSCNGALGAATRLQHGGLQPPRLFAGAECGHLRSQGHGLGRVVAAAIQPEDGVPARRHK